MLRDYDTTENWRLIDAALELFIDLPPRLSLVGYMQLSPDSFVWTIYDGQLFYMLYAEDYVPSLGHVKERINDFWQKDMQLEFMPVKLPIAFEDSLPNRVTQTYKPPADEYEFAKYAGQSGYDFVFLLKTNTNPGSE